MPFKIQRVPLGLNNFLTTFGGHTPTELEDRVRAVLELTQFYGLQHKQHLSTNDPALAEGGTVSAVAGQTVDDQWAVLFVASAVFIKTATMTALRGAVQIARRSNNRIEVASEELGPFGATETGAADVVFVPPYPLLLVPPWDIRASLKILGTDATANVTIQAEIGVLQ